jgi:hypothetical protein
VSRADLDGEAADGRTSAATAAGSRKIDSVMSSSAGEARPVLVDVEGLGLAVRVTLRVQDRLHVGESALPEERADDAALVAAAARATLAALERATPQAVGLRLEWSDVLHPDEDLPPMVVVLTTVTVADVPLRAPGSVLLRDRPIWAGARAVLQGLNRRLEILGL